MRLIDADALIKAHCDGCEYYDSHFCTPDDPVCGAVEVMNDAPTIDSVEVVHGWWDDSGRYQFPNGRKAIPCNICGCALSACEYHLLTWNYCPVCGAKMDGERKNDGK